MKSDSIDTQDVKLIHEFLNGDIRCFEQLVNKYQNFVYSTVLRLVGEKEDAEDLVEEIFIKLYSLLREYNLRYNFKSWLYKISVNCTIDFLRKKKNFKNVSIEPEKIYEISQKLVHAKECETIPEIYEIYKLIGKLNNKYREVLLLKYIEGLDDNEICEILNLNPVTVRVRLYRGIKILQKILGL